uniref:Uncharacterized protein n=1 Tax=Picea sitchensis TaxID=3332 RepID=A0A6B9XWK6_PICSI|nr:hypothetical protein Q903MT_gene4009 [Picea sitchensis]
MHLTSALGPYTQPLETNKIPPWEHPDTQPMNESCNPTLDFPFPYPFRASVVSSKLWTNE